MLSKFEAKFVSARFRQCQPGLKSLFRCFDLANPEIIQELTKFVSFLCHFRFRDLILGLMTWIKLVFFIVSRLFSRFYKLNS